MALEQFLLPLTLLSFEETDSTHYGAIRVELEKKGKTIGAMDLLIAAQALSRDLVLLTNHTAEFSRIAELKMGIG